MRVLILTILISIISIGNISSTIHQNLLTEVISMNKVLEASNKFAIVYHNGIDLNDNVISGEDLYLNNARYLLMGSSIDTSAKLYDYLKDTFTDNSIESIKNTLNIIEQNNNLYLLDADFGGTFSWERAEVLAISQNQKTAEVKFKVPLYFYDELDLDPNSQYQEITIDFQRIDDSDWLIDIENPILLY